MAWTRPHVVLLLVGGAGLGGSPILNRGVRRSTEVAAWQDELSELEMIAEVEPIFVAPDGAMIGPTHWARIAQLIRTHDTRADGFVILHEPHRAPLTAIALDAMVMTTGKPIVITPGRVGGGAGGRSNVISALQTATADMAEVVYVNGSSIIRASSIQPDAHSEQVRGVPIGKIDFGIRLAKHHPRRTQQRTVIREQIETDVAVLALLPNELTRRRIPPAAGYVLTGLPMSAVTPDMIKPLVTLFPARAPVIVCGAAGASSRWPVQWVAEPAMDAPVAAVRLMVALGQTPGSWRTFWRRWRAEGMST